MIQINNCADMAADFRSPAAVSKWTGATSSTAQTLTGEAAINANPTPEQIIPSPISERAPGRRPTREAEEEQRRQARQRQRDAAEGLLGRRQSQAAQDLLGFLTEDSR